MQFFYFRENVFKYYSVTFTYLQVNNTINFWYSTIVNNVICPNKQYKKKKHISMMHYLFQCKFIILIGPWLPKKENKYWTINVYIYILCKKRTILLNFSNFKLKKKYIILQCLINLWIINIKYMLLFTKFTSYKAWGATLWGGDSLVLTIYWFVSYK